MSGQLFRLTYDGGEASNNVMDMRQLGLSFQGADRILSDGLIVLTQQRPPKRSERSPLLVKVKEPVAGSYDVPGLAQEAAALLAMGVPIVYDIGSDYLWNWTKAVIAHFTGKDDIAEIAIKAMVDLTHDHLMARDAADARTHEERMLFEKNRHEKDLALINIARETIPTLSHAAELLVAPVGNSVRTLDMRYGDNPSVQIEEEQADAIRDYNKLDWTAVNNLALITDGFKYHTNGLRVENPETDGFLMADVIDPAFEEESNPYTQAAQKKAKIEVLARRGYKNQKLSKIQIVDYVRILDDTP